MQVQYKKFGEIITEQQAEFITHDKEYLQNGIVKIIEDMYDPQTITSVIYYKDLTETDEQVFDKYRAIKTVTSIYIKTRDYRSNPPYIIETKETFWRDGENFVDQLITTRELVDPLKRISAFEGNNRELPISHPEYRGVSKAIYFGTEKAGVAIPCLSTSFMGYGGQFDASLYDPGWWDDDQDEEYFDLAETIDFLAPFNFLPQSIKDWFLTDIFYAPPF